MDYNMLTFSIAEHVHVPLSDKLGFLFSEKNFKIVAHPWFEYLGVAFKVFGSNSPTTVLALNGGVHESTHLAPSMHSRDVAVCDLPFLERNKSACETGISGKHRGQNRMEIKKIDGNETVVINYSFSPL